jgi:predicted TIM-barrel fold metal-dependent hydrolase
MGNIKSLNSKITADTARPIHMIDANTYHCNVATWPVPLAYVLIENTSNETGSVHFIDKNVAISNSVYVDGVNVNHRTTIDIGRFLVRLNSRMYNEENGRNICFMKDSNELSQIWEDIKKLLNGRRRTDLKDKDELSQLSDLDRKERKLRKTMTDIYREDIPSFVIASTMDMEFAHIGGYRGEFIYQHNKEIGQVFYKKYGQCSVYLCDNDILTFQSWKRQISDVEAAVASHPSRLFPLFSYDPRRYRLSGPNDEKILGWGTWKEPFARIVGHSDSIKDIKKIWLGFCMNPTLGFRPFDEFCEHLPKFYKECEKHNIPILTNCVPGGVTTYEAMYYPDNVDERIDKNKERHSLILKEGLSSCQNDKLCSCMYYGGQRVVDDKYDGLNHFYMNYGHPRNWIPVLEYFPELHLCLAGFGGNSEWQLADRSDTDTSLLTRQWIQGIIKLTARYKNVYADISGLNIYDTKIRNVFLKMLDLIQDNGNDEFKHLKDKLIFGSGWYLTYLTNVSDGGKNVRHSYINYCREFKHLFDNADKNGYGELWERVSFINPWNFYTLSEDKIHQKNT